MNSPEDLEVYRSGQDLESGTFSGGLNFVSRVSTDGMFRIVDRLDLEGRNIPVKVTPVGGEKGAEELFGMFQRARQGFRLLVKMGDDHLGGIDPGKLINELEVSDEDTAERLVNEVFPSKSVAKPNEKFALSTALSFITTLRKLAQADRVNFYYLGIIPTDDDPRLILTPSYWKMNLTPENIWGTIGQLDQVIKTAVLQKGSIGDPTMLYKAAHFLAANTSLKVID